MIGQKHHVQKKNGVPTSATPAQMNNPTTIRTKSIARNTSISNTNTGSSIPTNRRRTIRRTRRSSIARKVESNAYHMWFAFPDYSTCQTTVCKGPRFRTSASTPPRICICPPWCRSSSLGIATRSNCVFHRESSCSKSCSHSNHSRNSFQAFFEPTAVVRQLPPGLFVRPWLLHQVTLSELQ